MKADDLSTARSALEERAADLSPWSRRLLVLAVMLATFMATLDQTIVGTALPRISAELGDGSLYTWVVMAYLLPATIGVPLCGRYSDLYGRKLPLLGGITIFLVGSVLCGMASDMPQLVAFRALQGLGAAALAAVPLAVLLELFPASAAARVQALFGVLIAISFIAGPYFGGVLTEHASWPWVFLVNVPIGLAVLVTVLVLLPDHRPPDRPLGRFDFAGMVVFAAAVSSLLIGLTLKGSSSRGWTDPGVAGPLAAALLLLVVFAFVELRAQVPFLPLRLFRNRGYATSTVAAFLVAFAMYPAIVFLPRYLQEVKGVEAAEAGLRLYPLMIGIVIGIMLTGGIARKSGRYKGPLLVALVLFGTGTCLFAGLEAGTGYGWLAAWMVLVGLGVGPFISGLTYVAQYSLPAAQVGLATSSVTFFRQIGGAVALACAGTLYADGLRDGETSSESIGSLIFVLGLGGAILALAALFLLPGERDST